MKQFLLGLILGAVIVFIAAISFMGGKTTVIPTHVTENPSHMSDVQIGVSVSGKLSGVAPIPVTPGDNNPGTSETPAAANSQKTPALYKGDTVNVPITGTETNIYIDKKTGKNLGTGTHTVTGVTKIEATDTEIKATTTFTSDTVIGIDVQNQKTYKNRLEVFCLSDGSTNANYKRTLLEYKNISVWAGTSYLQRRGYLAAGVTLNF